MIGLGEQQHFELRRNFNWQRLSIFTQDHEPEPDINLYGHQPFYMGLDKLNQTFGVFVQTTYPMDVFLQPNPELMTFRILGGEDIELVMFTGPSADDVIAQYTWFIGRPMMPPYWSLGFHLSRYGYQNLENLRKNDINAGQDVELVIFTGPTADDVIAQYTWFIGRPFLPPYWSLGFHLSRWGYNSLDNLKKVWQRNRDANIPQDVQTIDIDYMDRHLDFTVGQSFAGLPDFVKNEIHGSGRRLVPIVDPGIASDTQISPDEYEALKYGLELGIFINDSRTGKPLEGRVWPGKTFYPDFTNPKTMAYWMQMMSQFSEVLDYDGIWLDMNDPSNFEHGSTTGCASNALNNPPFAPVSYSPFYRKTLCLDAVHYAGTHMQWHNVYGHLEAKTTYQSLQANKPDTRPFLYTRSSGPGTGAFSAHWMGDTISDWPNLNQSIIQMIEFNMFGIPLCGSDICGFNKNTTEPLCLKWSQLGAFYPFSRNHNTDNGIDQDPAVWSAPTVAAIRESIETRYTLLPYLYTLFYLANTQGLPVVRAMWYDYPEVEQTWNMHEQFLWGKALLIAPILTDGNQRNVFIPSDSTWYNYGTGQQIKEGVVSITVKNMTDSMFIKGGSIIATQGSGLSTTESRQTPFNLLVAPDKEGNSNGQLFWDDGHSQRTIIEGNYCLVTFTYEAGSLVTSANPSKCDLPLLNGIQVNNVGKQPTTVSVNGQALDASKIKYDTAKKRLNLSGVKLNLTANRNTVTWK